jgi:hypothetical protein
MFGLLTVATLLVSAITYAPSAERFAEVLLAVTAALAAAFGLVAIWLQVEQRRRPESWVFSRSASRVAMFLAVVFAVAVKLLAIG